MKKIRNLFVSLFACILLAGCAPNSNREKAVFNLKGNDYVVVEVEGRLADLLNIEGLDAKVTATNLKDTCDIYYFETLKAANAFYKENKEDFKEAVSELKEVGYDAECGVWGKVVYFGTKAALDATR